MISQRFLGNLGVDLIHPRKLCAGLTAIDMVTVWPEPGAAGSGCAGGRYITKRHSLKENMPEVLAKSASEARTSSSRHDSTRIRETCRVALSPFFPPAK